MTPIPADDRAVATATGSIGDERRDAPRVSDEASLCSARIRWPTRALHLFRPQLTSTNPRYACHEKRQITLVSLSRYQLNQSVNCENGRAT